VQNLALEYKSINSQNSGCQKQNIEGKPPQNSKLDSLYLYILDIQFEIQNGEICQKIESESEGNHYLVITVH